jgi:hypothetical protein
MYEKAMQIFDLHRFFHACVGCVFGLAAVFGQIKRTVALPATKRAMRSIPPLSSNPA